MTILTSVVINKPASILFLGNTTTIDACPDKGETLKFWSNLWENPKEHNKDATQVKEIEKNIGSN